MKLSDIKPKNGTSIQSYADVLAEQCNEADLQYVFVFVDKKDRSIHTLTNVDANALPGALILLGQNMRVQPVGSITRTEPQQS